MSIATILAIMAAHSKLLSGVAAIAGIVVYMTPVGDMVSNAFAAPGGNHPPPGPEPQQADPFKGCQKAFEKGQTQHFQPGHKCYGYVPT